MKIVLFLLITLIFGTLILIIVLGWNSFYGLAIRGVSIVTISNKSGETLENVTIRLLWNPKGAIMIHEKVEFGNIPPGNSVLVKRKSDLSYGPLEFLFKGTKKRWNHSGILCNERVIFTIEEDGEIKMKGKMVSEPDNSLHNIIIKPHFNH